MGIRRFRKGDAGKVAYLIRKALIEVNSRDYPKRNIDYLLKNNTPAKLIERSRARDVYVVAEGKRILGTANIQDSFIGSVFVNPRFHGKGVGKNLVMFLEEKAGKGGCKEVSVFSSITAYGFYKRLGYRKVKVEYKKAGKVILMRKIL